MPNHHITKPVLIGEIQGNGQFDVVWQTPGLVPGDAWSPILDDSKNLKRRLDASPVNCGNFDTVARFKCIGKAAQVGVDRAGLSRTGRLSRSPSFPLSRALSHSTCLVLRPFCGPALACWPSTGHSAGTALAGRPRGPRRQSHLRRLERARRRRSPRRWRPRASERASADPRSPGRRASSTCRNSDKLAGSSARPTATSCALTEAVSGKPAGSAVEADLDRVRVNNRLAAASIEAAVGSLTSDEPQPPGAGSAPPTRCFKRRDATASAAARSGAGRRKRPAHQARDERGARRRRAGDRRLAADADKLGGDRRRSRRAATAMRWASCKAAAAALRPARSRRPPRPAPPRSSRRWPPGRSAQNVWYGISLGSVLLLAAIGLAITFGVMGVINMAHGEMVMLGAYTDLRGAGDHPHRRRRGLFDYSLADRPAARLPGRRRRSAC